jgi:hypothetical protein
MNRSAIFARDTSDEEESNYKRVARLELGFLKTWVMQGNHLACALIRRAVHLPTFFTSVDDFEGKLYTALTNVVWTNETEGVACMLSMREASGLVAFISSMLGETKRQTYLEGPYGVVRTGENLTSEEENEMHSLLRELGFEKLEVPPQADRGAMTAFWETIKLKYNCHSIFGFVLPAGEELFEAERSTWEKAVLAWVGEEPTECEGNAVAEAEPPQENPSKKQRKDESDKGSTKAPCWKPKKPTASEDPARSWLSRTSS